MKTDFSVTSCNSSMTLNLSLKSISRKEKQMTAGQKPFKGEVNIKPNTFCNNNVANKTTSSSLVIEPI